MTTSVGKSPTTWNLKIDLRPGFACDYDMEHLYPSSQLQTCDFDPWRNITARICYDGQVLTQHDFIGDQSCCLHFDLEDDMQNKHHDLQVTLYGLDINNNFFLRDHVITVGVMIKIYIEGIDCDWYLHTRPCFGTWTHESRLGCSFVSQNGTNQIELQTPIYAWLFEHEHAIVNQFYQKV